MDLTTWMEAKCISDDQVSASIGYSRPYVSRVRNGLVNISLEAALKVWEFTGKEIDLYQLLPRGKRPAIASMPGTIGTSPAVPVPAKPAPVIAAAKKPVRAAAPTRKPAPPAKPAEPVKKAGNGNGNGKTVKKPAAAPVAAAKPGKPQTPPAKRASRARASA